MRRNLMNVGLVATMFDTGPAWAYLDPGTGSMMLQALLGGIAGVMVACRLYWDRLREFVTSRFLSKSGESAPASHTHASARVEPPDE